MVKLENPFHSAIDSSEDIEWRLERFKVMMKSKFPSYLTPEMENAARFFFSSPSADQIIDRRGISEEESASRCSQFFQINLDIFGDFVKSDEFLAYKLFIEDKIGNNDEVIGKEYVLNFHRIGYFRAMFCELLGIFKAIEKKSDRERAVILLETIEGALFNLIFSPDPTAKSVKLFNQSQQSKQARSERAKKPRELALNTAIDAEVSGTDISRAYKAAESILSAVNCRLATSGFEPVKLDAVARRLKKRRVL